MGATRTYKTPADVADSLQPGDVVEIDGDATYTGGTAFWNAGEAGNPITVRGVRVNGIRPVLSGGNNTIEAGGDHYVFEGLEIRTPNAGSTGAPFMLGLLVVAGARRRSRLRAPSLRPKHEK